MLEVDVVDGVEELELDVLLLEVVLVVKVVELP